MNEPEVRDRHSTKDPLCRQEWIAMAMDAARRYKQSEQGSRSRDEMRAARSVEEESA
jgi:hypothetical protein